MKVTRAFFARVGLVVLSPVVFLGLAEVALAVFGGMKPRVLLHKVIHEGQAYWASNPRHGEVWFQGPTIPTPGPVWVPVDKAEGTRRVVLLGESAAAGFPMEDFNLARLVEAAWGLAEPGLPIEVVNLTMTGINSHGLRRFLAESMKLNPDAVVLYAGHNEAIGPFGPADRYGRRPFYRWQIKAMIVLRESRVGQVLGQATEGLAGLGWRPVRSEWAGLNAFSRRPLAWDDPALETMSRSFRKNVEEMLAMANRQGVPVLVSQPAVNLRDWPPLDSEPEALDDETARSWVTVGRLDELRSARQVYRLALEIEEKQGWQVARPVYRRASDLDRLRFRADSRIRDILASAVSAHPGRGHLLVDMDDAIREVPVVSHDDRELFLEHVHLTFEGLARVAASISANLVTQFAPSRGDPELVFSSPLAEQVFFTEIDEYIALRRTVEFLEFDVFAGQPLGAQRKHDVAQALEILFANLKQTWSVDRLVARYEALQKKTPQDPYWHKTAGRLFLFMNEPALARGALERFLSFRPMDLDAQLNLAHLAGGEARYEDALALVMGMKQAMPAVTKFDDLHSGLLLRMGRLDDAAGVLQATLRKNPRNDVAMVNLASVYQLAGYDGKAIRWYRQYLALQPRDADALNNLAWLLVTRDGSTKPEWREAVTLATQALLIDQDNHRIKGTLSVAYAKMGETLEAARWASQARSGATEAGDLNAVHILQSELERLGISTELD